MARKTKLPARLVTLAERAYRSFTTSDYRDVAANRHNALVEAECRLGYDGLLAAAGMPDGRSCPRAFLNWWATVEEPAPRGLRNILNRLVREGKWADAYVRVLGILEHVDECRTLKSRWDELTALTVLVAAACVLRTVRA